MGVFSSSSSSSSTSKIVQLFKKEKKKKEEKEKEIMDKKWNLMNLVTNEGRWRLLWQRRTGREVLREYNRMLALLSDGQRSHFAKSIKRFLFLSFSLSLSLSAIRVVSCCYLFYLLFT